MTRPAPPGRCGPAASRTPRPRSALRPWPRPARTPGRPAAVQRGDRGSVAVELTLLAPAIVVLMLFLVALGRLSDAQARLDQATFGAARAASLTRDPVSAISAARQTATATLTRPAACTALTVTVDTTRFAAGGAVTVRVACTVSLADLTSLGLPGSRTLDSTSTSPLDRFRAVTP